MRWDGTLNGPPDWMRHLGTHRPLAVEARLTNNVPKGKTHHFIIFINIYYGQIKTKLNIKVKRYMKNEYKIREWNSSAILIHFNLKNCL
jgi:hypothetical protein